MVLWFSPDIVGVRGTCDHSQHLIIISFLRQTVQKKDRKKERREKKHSEGERRKERKKERKKERRKKKERRRYRLQFFNDYRQASRVWSEVCSISIFTSLSVFFCLLFSF